MAISLSSNFYAKKIYEFSKNTEKEFLLKFGQEKYNEIKYHIILGDGGFMQPGNQKKERDNYKSLNLRPFPVLCVLGEYEQFFDIKNPPEKDIGLGGPVYQISEKPVIAYLKRGKIYTIDGIKFLVLGGALSADKNSRIQNKTRREKKYWDEQEKKDLFKLLETDNTFDFVLSHTGPQFMNKYLFGDSPLFNEKSSGEASFFNNEIHDKIRFHEWWCGHWLPQRSFQHIDGYCFDEKTGHGYQYLYKRIKIIEKTESGFLLTNEYGMLNR